MTAHPADSRPGSSVISPYKFSTCASQVALITHVCNSVNEWPSLVQTPASTDVGWCCMTSFSSLSCSRSVHYTGRLYGLCVPSCTNVCLCVGVFARATLKEEKNAMLRGYSMAGSDRVWVCEEENVFFFSPCHGGATEQLWATHVTWLADQSQAVKCLYFFIPFHHNIVHKMHTFLFFCFLELRVVWTLPPVGLWEMQMNHMQHLGYLLFTCMVSCEWGSRNLKAVTSLLSTSLFHTHTLTRTYLHALGVCAQASHCLCSVWRMYSTSLCR